LVEFGYNEVKKILPIARLWVNCLSPLRQKRYNEIKKLPIASVILKRREIEWEPKGLNRWNRRLNV
jgi:hypothetical protein